MKQNNNTYSDILKIMWNWKIDKKSFFIILILLVVLNVWYLYLPNITANIYLSIENHDQQNIYFFVVLWIAVWFFSISLDLLRWFLLNWLKFKINNAKYSEYINKLLSQNISIIYNYGSWKLLTIFNQWVEAESNIFRVIFKSFWSILVRGAACVYILYSIDPILIILLFLVLIIMFFIQKYFNKFQTELNKKVNYIIQKSNRVLIKIISEMLLVKINNKQSLEKDEFQKIYTPIIRYKQNNIIYWDGFYFIMWFLFEVLVLIAIWYFGLRSMDIPTIIKITWYIYLVWGPLQELLTNISSINEDLSKYHELQSFLNIPNKIINWCDKYIYNSWDIRFENVDFAYNEDRKILDNLTIDFESSKTTALVWHSWSGKSTIIKLILRLYDIDTGKITIDDQNLKDLDISSLYDYVWYLTQEPAIFDGTIRENLMYGLSEKSEKWSEKPEKDNKSDNISDINNIEKKDNLILQEIDKLLRNWLKLAKAEELVKWLKDGLETEIGEKGIKLSGGERQRLAIARIFIKNPKILILDEPTSALDSISEHAITQALSTLMKDRTVIIIAHRLQTVMHADKIYVMENGQIIEQWNHKDLLAKWWVYSELVDLQSGLIKE